MTYLWTAWRWLSGTKAGKRVGIAFAAILGVLWYGRTKHSQGRDDAQQEAREDAQKRVEKGREAVRDSRDDDPDEQLRKNDGRW